MKKVNLLQGITLFVLLIIISTTSCNTGKYFKYIYTTRISVQEAIDKKEEIDKSDNPAKKFLITNELKKKRIEIDEAIVKDIIASRNIDYNFCVIVSVQTNKGPIDCHIYSNDFFQQEDIKTVSHLLKGKSKIEVDGEFFRFITLLDDTFTKIEIINAEIDIIED